MELPFTDPATAESRETLPYDGSARLIPTFIGLPEATDIFERLRSEIPWGEHHLVLFGKKMNEPRLSAWVAEPGVAYAYSGVKRAPEPWTPTLTHLRQLCEASTGTTFNSVLANLYRTGGDSMGWHADDEPELGTNPVIASLSFGAERRFDFKHRTSGETVSVVLPHGSLLVMSGASQACWKHRIARTKRVDAPRINLTYRLVHPRG